MSPELLALMELQGELRVLFLRFGIDDAKAYDLACEALHCVATSKVIRDDIREAYDATTVAK